jgi:hypothetical protein
MKKQLTILLLAVLSVFLLRPLLWAQGTAAELSRTHNQASSGSIVFNGAIVFTDDPEWKEKWSAPLEGLPNFDEVNELHRGKSAKLLFFYCSAHSDSVHQAHVNCDIRISKPNGRIVEERGIDIYNGPALYPLDAYRLASRGVTLSADPDQPLGKWHIEVTLRDLNTSDEVVLDKEFELVE